MTNPAADRHNELAREFLMKVVRETGSYSELMVVVETIMLASMKVMKGLYGFPPPAAVEMVELAVQQATDRFAKDAGR
jgi:hypothetical protein